MRVTVAGRTTHCAAAQLTCGAGDKGRGQEAAVGQSGVSHRGEERQRHGQQRLCRQHVRVSWDGR